MTGVQTCALPIWAVPLVSCFITPAVFALAALSLLSPALASHVSGILSTPTGWMLDALRSMATWPGGAVVIAQPDGVALGLAVVSVGVLLAPRPVPWRVCWIAGLLPLMLRGPAPVPPGGFRLTAFDVGQGMAVLIEADGKRLLYDAGPASEGGADAGARVIVPALRAQGISHLDMLVISHADTDHSGGAASVLRLIGADQVFSSIPEGHRLLEGIPQHQACMRGHAWQWGTVRFEYLHPGPEFPPGAARSPTNARSCVLKIDAPAEKLRPLNLGTSSDLQVGQKVFAIGNPFGLDQTLTTGIISSLGRELKTPKIGRAHV